MSHQEINLFYWREQSDGWDSRGLSEGVGFYWGLLSMPCELVEKYSTAGSIAYSQLWSIVMLHCCGALIMLSHGGGGFPSIRARAG